MEEIESRFEIIRIAVNLADYETIETQIRHLRNISTDKHLHEILHDLENRNFRQALFLMRDYAASLQDDFFAPSLSAKESEDTVPVAGSTDRPSVETAQESPAVENDLFSAVELSAEQIQEDERVLGLEEMLQMTKEQAPAPRTYDEPSSDIAQPSDETSAHKADEVDDPLFTLDQEIPAAESEDIPQGDLVATSTFVPKEVPNAPTEETSGPLFEGDEAPEDDFLSFAPEKTEETSPREAREYEIPTAVETVTADRTPSASEEADPLATLALDGDRSPHDSAVQPTSQEDSAERETTPAIPTDETAPASEAELKGTDLPSTYAWEHEAGEEEELYEKFAYMGQKFRNMLHQYPQLEEREEGVTEEVNAFIQMVSTQDYAESQVEAAIQRYQELKAEGKRAEAAQMLIAAATTESTFAQFMLARELFKGDVLVQNYPESFTQINRLAEEDYPEAICDLGQLYEYGIGIDKNKHHALLLYEEAAQMGVERAKNHYERLKNSNPIQSIKSLTGSLFGKKSR